MGAGELGLIILVLLLVFGPSRLPKLARGLGEMVREFRKARRGTADEAPRHEPPDKPPDR